MKPNPEPSSPPLLEEVLFDSELGRFRESTLELVVSLARSRRRRRRQVRGAAAVVFSLLMVAGVWLSQPKPTAVKREAYQTVNTRPIPTGILVRTVGTTVPIARSESAQFAVVRTEASPRGFRVLTDEALLAAFSGRPLGWIHDVDGHRRLVFLDGTQIE